MATTHLKEPVRQSRESEEGADVKYQRPLLFQVNTRVYLGVRGRALGRPATLDDVPDELLDALGDQGFAWAWFLGVWTTGPMLVLPDVFFRTWGNRAMPADDSPPAKASFWPEAISRVRDVYPAFLFMAEVYWDMEWTLQQQGFDFTYDKRLYDRLTAKNARAVREHLWATPDFQEQSARFLENHDEPRAAATFDPEQHRAAAVITFFVPGLRFFYEGQFDGRKVHVSMHLGRRPEEPRDDALHAFYERLIAALGRREVHEGNWQLAGCCAAWEGNPTWDNFIVMGWEAAGGRRLLAVANYGPTQAQCYARIPFKLGTGAYVLRDLLSDAHYTRNGADLAERGLYLDLPPWGRHVFSVESGPAPAPGYGR